MGPGRRGPRGASAEADVESAVRAEIEGLHEFFVGWFSGALPEDAFEAGFSARFDPEFLLVPPAGTLLDLAQLSGSVRAGRATNPEFRIAIRNVKVRRRLDDVTSRIEAAGARIAEIDGMFCAADYFARTPADEIRAAKAEQRQLQREVADLLAKWEDLERELVEQEAVVDDRWSADR